MFKIPSPYKKYGVIFFTIPSTDQGTECVTTEWIIQGWKKPKGKFELKKC